MVEVVAATMIVGLMSVAALNGLGAATRSSESIGNRAVAMGLADDLMSEILLLPYRDPNETPVFGPEPTETAGPRSAYDDIDDYNGWNQSPPKNRDGAIIPNRTDYRHRVQVTRVVANNPTQSTSGNNDEGVKRIQVVVEYRSLVLAELVAIRTDTD